MTSKDAIEASFLSDIEYEVMHNDTLSLYKEVDKIDVLLKKNGYFLLEREIVKKDRQFTVTYVLGPQIREVHIRFANNIEPYQIGDTIQLKTSDVEPFLKKISNQLDQEGKSFSEVSLHNFNLTQNILFASLRVSEKAVRRIDKIIVKGYESISKKIIRHGLNLQVGNLFNTEKLSAVSKSISGLPFIEEIKPPEVLFTPDSTIVYVYLKKKSSNSFDGIISFASNDQDNSLLFNGNIDLKLNNVFHGGEQLSVFWNSIGNERQEFSLQTQIPYVFNSRISPQVKFNLYKQDSTFLNTEFSSRLDYKVNDKSSISINYLSISSNNLQENITTNNVESFDRNLTGIGYQFKSLGISTSGQQGLNIQTGLLFGKRTTAVRSDRQYSFTLEASKLFQLNTRNEIFLKNQSGILISDQVLDNEVFRIGGVHSIRGFNEQSIFTSEFTYLNAEYRYITSRSSYLYSITDFGVIKSLNSSTETLLGLGMGYLFSIKSTQVNLGLVLGKSSDNDFNFNDTKLNVSFTSFF